MTMTIDASTLIPDPLTYNNIARVRAAAVWGWVSLVCRQVEWDVCEVCVGFFLAPVIVE